MRDIAMDILEPDILLNIVEHSDLTTVNALREVPVRAPHRIVTAKP